MTRFRDAVHDLAEQAPPVGELAERALDGARRKHRRALVPAAAAAMIAAISAGVLLVSMLAVPVQDPLRDNAGDPKITTDTLIDIPDTAPRLPTDDVGAALMAYSINCEKDDPSEFPPQCWRIMTTDRKHWSVSDAAASTHQDPGAIDSPVVVAPIGDRIAYVRPNGTFVIRHLQSGTVDEIFQWTRREISFLTISWSANGRWIVVTPDGGDVWGFKEPTPNALLVDTDTMDTVDISAYGRSFGVSNSKPFPFGFETSTSARGIPRVDALPVIDHAGRQVGAVSAKLLPGRQRHIDGVTGKVSPDGRVLAAIGTNYSDQQDDPNYGATALTFIDVANNRVAHEYFYHDHEHTWLVLQILGWRDNSTLLVMLGDRQLKANPDPEDDYPYEGELEISVVGLDVETGNRTPLIRFSDYPNQLSLAPGLLDSGG